MSDQIGKAIVNALQTTCSRGACQDTLEGTCYRIWNDPIHWPYYRQYCRDCGRKIIAYSPELRFEICDPNKPAS